MLLGLLLGLLVGCNLGFTAGVIFGTEAALRRLSNRSLRLSEKSLQKGDSEAPSGFEPLNDVLRESGDLQG